MHNTKLIQLFKTLSKKEIKDFKDFVYSPFYNKNKKVILLFEYLRRYHPGFDSPKLDEKIVFAGVFKNEKYDYYKLKNISSDLLAIAREFLFVSGLNVKENHKNKILLEQYRSRSLDSLYEQLYKNMKSVLEDNPVRDEYYYSEMLDLSVELKSYYSPKEPNSHLNLFQEQLDHLLEYSLIRLLRLYNTMLHENKQNNFSYDFKMFDEVFTYLKNRNDESNHTLTMYYYIILLEKHGDEKYFYKLKEQFNKHYINFNLYDKYMYYLHMSGFCADMYNFHCRTDFTREHFLLSKDNFEKGTIQLGKVLYMDFMNHVKIALRVDEFEWAEKYINAFKDKLSEEKENALNFCYACINYKKRNLSEALNLFSKVSFSNFIMKIQLKIFLLQINFELGYYEQALNMIDTFRHYLKRENSILENYKESYYEYLRITGEMIRLQMNLNGRNKKQEMKIIKSEIEKIRTNQFGIKLWLMERLQEIS